MPVAGGTIWNCEFRVTIQRNFQLKRKLLTVAGLVALASLLGACGAMNWFSSSDDKKQAAEGTETAAPAGPRPPDPDALRKQMAEGLVPDRKNARHTTGTIARQSEQLDPPPARQEIRIPPPDRPPPAPAPGASPPVAAAPPQAAEEAVVEEAGLPKAGAQPPAQVRMQSPAKPPPTPESDASTRVAAAAPPPGASGKLAGEPRYRVQLAAFRSKTKALLELTSLTDALKGVVDERLFAIDDSGNDGFSRVVLSGTFATREAATAACGVVKERGKDCYVARIR